MFELTNEQRRCFAIPPVLDAWKRVEVKSNPYDHFITYAYLDGQRIVKVIQASDASGREMYQEYSVDQMLSEDGTKILPKTERGKPQNFTASNLIKKAPIGMAFCYCNRNITIVNNTTEQCYYRSAYSSVKLENLSDLASWVEEWCYNTKEKELAKINEFAKQAKVHQGYQEGDFFRYRIDRNLYGYGRILVDYAKMRKDKVPFWDVFMGKPLCVVAYHIATEDANIKLEQLACLKMLPSQMIMDNIFYYGECKIIGNMPIAPDEDNYTIHYGRSISARKPDYLYYQCGKTFVALKNGDAIGRFINNGIGWDLDAKLPILRECIKSNSNEPYWSMIPTWEANQDLRNPKYKDLLKQIKQQMRIQ